MAAPLVPYKTVGIFLCAIMALSGAVTLMVLSPIIKIAEKKLFKDIKQPQSAGCNCMFCLILSIAGVVLVAMNLQQYWKIGWSRLTWISIIAIPVMALICGIMSRRQACKIKEKDQNE